MTPSRELPRLAIATAIPREVDTLAGGTAAVREGSEARMKAREKYILSRTIKRFVAGRCSRMSLEKYRGHSWGFYIRGGHRGTMHRWEGLTLMTALCQWTSGRSSDDTYLHVNASATIAVHFSSIFGTTQWSDDP
jgi:hypothetical protein